MPPLPPPPPPPPPPAPFPPPAGILGQTVAARQAGGCWGGMCWRWSGIMGQDAGGSRSSLCRCGGRRCPCPPCRHTHTSRARHLHTMLPHTRSRRLALDLDRTRCTRGGGGWESAHGRAAVCVWSSSPCMPSARARWFSPLLLLLLWLQLLRLLRLLLLLSLPLVLPTPGGKRAPRHMVWARRKGWMRGAGSGGGM